MIASTLSLLVKNVAENLEVKGVEQGFSRKLLEAKAFAVEKAKN